MKPFFLHCGLPKTATTTLQTIFLEHSDIAYLGKHSRAHWKLQEVDLQLESDMRRLAFRSYKDWLSGRSLINLERIEAQLNVFERANDDKKVLLGSWETQILKPPGYFRWTLRNLLCLRKDLQVLITLRNPVDWLHSLYLQALKPGVRKSRKYGYSPYWLGSPAFISFDYWHSTREKIWGAPIPGWIDANLTCLIRTLGRQNLHLSLFENLRREPQNFYAELSGSLGIDQSELQRLASNTYRNPTTNQSQITHLQNAQQQLDITLKSRARIGLSKSQIKSLRSEFTALTGTEEKIPIEMQAERAERIYKSAAEVGRKWSDILGVDLQALGYPSL